MGTSAINQQLRSGNRCYVSLACSIGSMSLACGSLLQIPNTTDRISLQRGFFLISLGFIYFVSLTDFCNKYLLETPRGLQFRKKYRLMMSDVMEITNKIVSAIQASFSFLVGFIVCKSTCTRSFVYASHFLMEAYGWFGTAYFMYDIWSMYKVHTQKIADKLKLLKTNADACLKDGVKAKTKSKSFHNGIHANTTAAAGLYDKCNGTVKALGNTNKQSNGNCSALTNGSSNSVNGGRTYGNNVQHAADIFDYDGESVQIPKDGKWDFLKYLITHPVMMIHHVFIGTFGLLVVTYIRGGGHCIYSYMYMMEFSTPFVSMRSILSTMGLKDTRTYIINGLLMLGTFFMCRVFMWPYVMWRYSIAIDATFWQAMIGLPRGCMISIMILFLPQIYWFFLMVKGALKVFFPSKSKRNKTTAKSQSKNNNLSPVTDGNEQFLSNGQLPLNGSGDYINKTLDKTADIVTTAAMLSNATSAHIINGQN